MGRDAHLQEAKAEAKERNQDVEIFLPRGLTPHSFNASTDTRDWKGSLHIQRAGRERDGNSL